jgi:hypothetical protein
MRNAVVLCAGLLTLMIPSLAKAQTQTPAQSQGQSNPWMPAGGRIFVSINGLYQPGEETIEQSTSYSVYEETAIASATQNVKNGGGMFDIGGGYRTSRYGIGISYTQFKSTNSASISGSIPHPLFTDQPRAVSSTLDGLEHTEHVVHVQAYYFVPVARKMDVGVFIGPSFFSVRQDYVTGLNTFNPPHDPPQFEPPPYQTVSIPAGRGTAKDSPVGFNIGGELTYMLTPNVAGAFLLRFSRANADFDFEGASHSMNVGNVQVGAGVRLRF